MFLLDTNSSRILSQRHAFVAILTGEPHIRLVILRSTSIFSTKSVKSQTLRHTPQSLSLHSIMLPRKTRYKYRPPSYDTKGNVLATDIGYGEAAIAKYKDHRSSFASQIRL